MVIYFKLEKGIRTRTLLMSTELYDVVCVYIHGTSIPSALVKEIADNLAQNEKAAFLAAACSNNPAEAAAAAPHHQGTAAFFREGHQGRETTSRSALYSCQASSHNSHPIPSHSP